MGDLTRRPTADLIVLGLAALIGAVLLVVVVAIAVDMIAHPNADLGPAVGRVGELLTTLLGVVIGYLAGRNVPPRDPQDPASPAR